MATATLAQIKAGLKANLDTVYSSDYTVTAYIPTSPSPPSIDIAPLHPTSIEYDVALQGGSHCLYFIVRVIAVGADIDWQIALDQTLDPDSDTSLRNAIATDTTLGGIVSWARVVKASGYHQYQTKGSLEPVMGVEFTIEVQT